MIDFGKYDDFRLIALIRKGGKEGDAAFREIYRRYSDKLHSYCFFKSESIQDSKELHQEAWIKFHDYIGTTKNEIFLPLILYRIAKNLSIDKYRSARNFTNFSDLDLERIAAPFNLQTNLENNELLSIISLTVNNMDNIYKETFILKWFSGLNYKEISEIEGITVECARQRCCRAMEELLKTLKPIIKEISN